MPLNAWALPTAAAPVGPSPAALAALVAGIGTPGFAAATLGWLNEARLQAASWAVYRTWRDRRPVLHLSSSVGVADTTRDCFAAYHAGLYRGDRSFDAVAPGEAAVLRMHADEAPSRDHREAIYRRHGVLERLSVARREDDGSLLAVNVYHHQHQGRFGDGELAGFASLAPLLLAAVQRHLAWPAAGAGGAEAGDVAPAPGEGPAGHVDPGGPASGAADRGDGAAGRREALQRRCPALTARELDVCERLLRGWSYDGIAADLGLSVATVKTYRARAFERLGLHFKSELFAAFVGRG
ncbi:helix-turn-helix transcriptional regulator [Piscinibacter sakaiensis]|uniref:Transcriptional regulatory protein n=1 Tax=Piscinibacter sakaiensis TaxID=1547922 RepID=A0A0K8P4Q5_PISS1|nr:helix-turn-helix transcriptional regulator [Piscinibacter sakaiensis]GAP37642.1 transcriptional regulatory protein [Piscinibacter sakaiensis]